jgi:hypothetical protein
VAELSSGIVLRSPADLRNYLTRQPDHFPTTVTRRLMMYATNRELDYYDMPEVRAIVRDAAASNYSFAALVEGVVNSNAFRFQGVDKTPTGTPAAHPTKTASTNAGANPTGRVQLALFQPTPSRQAAIPPLLDR